MFTKKAKLAAALAVSALSASVLATVPAHAATKTIVVWADDQRGPALKRFLDGNTTIAPGYTFKVSTYANYDALNSAWLKSTAASGPDMMFHPTGDAVTAAKNGKALPFTLSATAKKSISATALAYGQYKGKQYGLPLDIDTTALYWNNKFGAAPKTFEEFVKRFLDAKAAGKATVGFCAGDGTWGSLPLLTAVGGGAWGYQKDGVTPDVTKVLFNSAAAVTNIKKYLVGSDGKSNGFFQWGGWDECGQTWLAGNAMAMQSGSWRLAATQEKNIDFTLTNLPTVGGKGKTHQWSGFGGAFITAHAKTHGVLLGVQKAINWLASTEGSLSYAVAVNRPSPNTSVASKVSADARGFALSGANYGLVQENALLGDSTGGANWYDVLGTTYTDIFVNGKDVKETLDKAAAILSRNWAAGIKNR